MMKPACAALALCVLCAGAALGQSADAPGALSLEDAISKQLGLKLVKQKRPVPVLVIDHIDEKPTEN